MLPITQLNQLPTVCGIYKIVNAQGIVIYVGQSKNIYKRWKNGHHILGEIIAKYGIEGIYIEWVEVPEWLLNRAENTAVTFYKPELNSQTPPIV
ncbi:MAG: GIY-YIG nuclease family protein [Microcystaceae cyanobacterium]